VFVRVVREDPTRRGLLYAGTETGVFVSYDDGGSWRPAKGNLPTVPIHDLLVKQPEGDLVLATHGRSFWIYDDLGPIRQLPADLDEHSAALVKPRPAVRYMSSSGFAHKAVPGKNYRMPGAVMVTFRQREDPRTGEKADVFLDAGKNPPDGAIISYFLHDKPESDISLTFCEADGKEIRTFSSKAPDERAAKSKKPKEPRIPKEAGLNRFVWNLRYPDATRVDDDDAANELVEGGLPGPVVAPGSYRVKLQVDDRSVESDLVVTSDPRVNVSAEQFQEQFKLLLVVRDKLSETHTAINQIRGLKRRAEDWLARATDKPELQPVHAAATVVIERLKPIESELIQVDAKSRWDELTMPGKLNRKLAALVGSIASADGPPTRAAAQVFDSLSQRVDAQLSELRSVIETEVAALNTAIRDAGLPPVGI
jgi:hypothetical protein